MSIIQATSNVTVVSVTVTASAESLDALGFSYGKLSTPVSLTAGQEYYLVSMEKNGGDYFFGRGGPNPSASTTPNLILVQSAYFFQGAWHTASGADTMYGPVNCLFAE